MPATLTCAIIGAGPYALSIAAHLRALDVDFRVFGKPMEDWVHAMPDGMMLKSEGFALTLFDPSGHCTLQRYCETLGIPYSDTGTAIPKDRFVAYGRDFQNRCVPTLDRRLVTEVRRLSEMPSSGKNDR